MNNEIVKILQSLPSLRILVIGDLMVDHFTWGTVSRISPEAPTPILAYEKETYQLGGAGFTANVLHQLGAQVDLAAVCGDDSGRDILLKLLEEQNIGSSGIIVDSSRPTTRKQRFQARDADLSSGMQQMLRVDFESTEAVNAEIEKQLISFIADNCQNYDAIIASDYGKGVLTQGILETVASCKDAVPIFADPKKGASLALYKGFTAMKPNRFEAESYVGFSLDSRADIIRAGKIILKEADLDYTFISLDAEGIFYIQKDHTYLFVPTKKKEVYDVAGAGDSVLSIMALLGKIQIPPRYLMEVANIAAGIMISQKQPKTITREDIIKHLLVGDDVSRKVKTPIELKAILNSSECRSRKVYFTNGFFDNISPIQIKFLEKLGMYEGIRIVAINSDQSILAAGHKPYLKESDRIRLLQMFDCIDYVVIFDDSSCDQLLEEIEPDFFLKGSNYKSLEITEQKTLDEINCKVEFIDAD